MIHLHRAERADRLVDALADVIAEPPEDPLSTEFVAVHSRGIERWLAQELSARLGAQTGRDDGVCANIDFPFPSRVIGRALAAAVGIDPDGDPWAPERLVWPLLAEIDTRLEEEWLRPLRVHLAGPQQVPDPARRTRRFGAARHLADLFDRYAVHRPELVRAWARGVSPRLPGVPDAVDEWQARLWWNLRQRLATPSPAERLADGVVRLREDAAVPDLPARLSLFGLTALPASYMTVLSALAEFRSVHLFLLHPSPVLWERVAARLHGGTVTVPRREDDATRSIARNPLLASWGRDARELQIVVATAPHVGQEHQRPEAADERTLLGRIQADIRADRRPPGAPRDGLRDARAALASDDRSLQVHACHGRTRQVEVLRDAVLHLLAQDPTLEPRDVVVLCPDIETFAPIVHAVFGAQGGVDRADGAMAPGPATGRLPDLRVRLADRALRQTNPVLRVVAELLELADGRLGASQVCDLAAREPVRRRFGFDDGDLERVESWVAAARIRWGLDADHRAAFGLDGLMENTWQAGLDRVLLGVTMADEDDRLVGGAVPLDDVEGGDVELAGRVAEFVQRLAAALTALRGPLTVSGWRTAIGGVADAVTSTTERTGWQRLQLHRLLDDLVTEATLDGTPSNVELALPEVRTLLANRLRGRPSPANHRTGDLTVCTLVPMRSVPHRVICLLGMDDGTFPRRTAGDGDDLIDRDPHVGDRDARTEDRQLLLDALLAATQHLVITYTGRDERTNEPRPPAVPIGELLDVVDRTARTAGGGRARDRLVVEHPLQAFDPRNFTSGRLRGNGPWGFDGVLLDGARRLTLGQLTSSTFLTEPLPPPEGTGVVELADLVAFVQHPVRAFLRQRLGVTLPRLPDEPDDAISIELSALERYQVGDRLLDVRLAGGNVERWTAAERARGLLPPAALATKALDDVTQTVAAVLTAASDRVALDQTRHQLEVDVPILAERRLRGTVNEVAGDVLLAVRYARVGPKHRLAAWVLLLAASAAHPERPLRAVTVGRVRKNGSKPTVSVATLGPLAGTPDERRERALAHLATLVDLYDRGMCAPLPVYCKTSAAYAEAVLDGQDGETAASRMWVTGYQFPNEDRDAEHLLALGVDTPFDALLADPPCADENGDGWSDQERHRFGRYARRVWEGLLAHEKIENL